MSDLTSKTCTPCRGGIPPMERSAAEQYLADVPGWELDETASRLQRGFHFPDYPATVAFVERVAALAEQENHHPDVCFSYSDCTVSIQTHKIHGLHENDFILAAKINRAAGA